MSGQAAIERARRDASRVLDSYGLLLIVIVAVLFIFSIIDPGRWSSVLLTFLLGATLLLALRTSGAGHRAIRMTQVILALSLALALAGGLGNVSAVRKSLSVLWALAGLSATTVVIRRILGHRVVTSETILGAVCAYLLIGLTFVVTYSSIQIVSGDPFFAGGKTGDAPDFIYFSFVTLTTLGYGDFTPASDLGRFTAVFEAILGQVFLVTIVARLVSLLGRERPTASRDGVGVRSPDEG